MAHIIALFNDSDSAGKAVAALKQEDATDDISVVTKEYDEGYFDKDKKQIKNNITEGATAGAAGGGLIGLLAGLAAIPVPGTELLAIGGIGTTLASTAAGAAGGTLVGSLVDYGLDQTKAKEYDKYVSEGQVMVAVKVDSDSAQRLSELVENHSPTQMTVTSS